MAPRVGAACARGGGAARGGGVAGTRLHGARGRTHRPEDVAMPVHGQAAWPRDLGGRAGAAVAGDVATAAAARLADDARKAERRGRQRRRRRARNEISGRGGGPQQHRADEHPPAGGAADGCHPLRGCAQSVFERLWAKGEARQHCGHAQIVETPRGETRRGIASYTEEKRVVAPRTAVSLLATSSLCIDCSCAPSVLLRFAELGSRALVQLPAPHRATAPPRRRRRAATTAAAAPPPPRHV